MPLTPAAGSAARRFGAERFQKELLAQMRRSPSLAPRSNAWSRCSAPAPLSISATTWPIRTGPCRGRLRELFELVRDYGPEAVAAGAGQSCTPQAPSAPTTSPTSSASSKHAATVQPPVRLKDPRLNELATDPLSLAEYDAFILAVPKGIP